jgi:hypothetical protein
MSGDGLDPSHIIEVGAGFWPPRRGFRPARSTCSAIWAAPRCPVSKSGNGSGSTRARSTTFLDALVAPRFLERDGEGTVPAWAMGRGRAIHWAAVDRTSSPTPAATQATPDRRIHTIDFEVPRYTAAP